MPDTPATVTLPPAVTQLLNDLVGATRDLQVTNLAAAIIAASGHPFTIGDALALRTDLYYAMHPAPGQGRYELWAKNKTAALAKAW
jgi:hypothetical protein